MTDDDIVICSPVRTAIGAFNGSLKTISAVKLGSTAIRAVIERSGLAPVAIDAAIMGNVVQAGNKMNPARQASVEGGLPVSVPAYTVNRVCGSGAQALISAALEVKAGIAKFAIAGGHGEHGYGTLPAARWPLGSPAWRSTDTRQYAY